MPYQSIWEARGLLTRWSGKASTAELIQMQEHAHASPGFDFARYSIHDFSECTSFARNDEEIQYAAALDGAAALANPNVKIAVVGANTEITEMVNAYLNAHLSPYCLRFFASLEEARAWVS